MFRRASESPKVTNQNYKENGKKISQYQVVKKLIVSEQGNRDRFM